MSTASSSPERPPGTTPTQPHGLVRAMGMFDVILFCIASVLGPRWIASAAHSGPSSISIWILAALLFFVPSALVIVELGTRFPLVGGTYVWAREAFGPFHGFLAGWCYWVYSIVYFPALLMASVAMATYIGGPSWARLTQNHLFMVGGSLLMLALAVGFNLVGVNIGKWLENAGSIGTWTPLALLVIFGALVAMHWGSATHMTLQSMKFHLDWGTVNYWSQIAFAFSGMELVCTMSEEVRDPQRVMPRAVLVASLAIAFFYILGTVATLAILPPQQVDIRAGAIQAVTSAASHYGIVWLAVIAATVLAIGNIGGIGATVAGEARIPFAAGIDRYLPRAFGHIHPTWRTPWVAMLTQGVLAALLLVISQIGQTATGAYILLVDATTILYLIALSYMFLSMIGLRNAPDRGRNPGQTLVPLGRLGVWLFGGLGLAITLLAIIIAFIPPSDVGSPVLFEVKIVVILALLILPGLVLYSRKNRRAPVV